jgi:hypothetical protein
MADELTNPLVKLIQDRLPWLFSDYGFKVTTYSYDARAFGNCIAVLESEKLRLSFSRDRGFSQAYVAALSDPTRSYELGFLMMALTGERPDVGFEGNAALLHDNWPLLTEALGPRLAETRQEYERREEISKETLERFTNRLPVTPEGFVKSLKKTKRGRAFLYLLRLAELGILLLALYAIFNYRN